LPPPSYIYSSFTGWFDECDELEQYLEKSAMHLSEKETLAPLYVVGKEISRSHVRSLELENNVKLKIVDCHYYLSISLPNGLSN